MASRQQLKPQDGRTSASQRSVGILLMTFGGMSATAGLAGALQHKWWIRGYNPTLGTFGIVSTISLLAVGVFLLVLGVLTFCQTGRQRNFT
jgi:hypothetical protein